MRHPADLWGMALSGRISALISMIILVTTPFRVEGQTESSAEDGPLGWEITGFPALNFDSDEGFGYGFVLGLYDYGTGGFLPYKVSLQPRLFLTTEGRRELTLFMDAPHILPGGLRLDAFLGFEKQIATPYYGPGNNSGYLEENESTENPYFYRFGRERVVLRGNLQRPLGSLPVRLLVGAQIAHFTIDPTPKGEGTTLLSEELEPGEPIPGGRQNSVRVGIVWDTRDKESGPNRGVWLALLVERVDEALGSEESYTRLTLSDHRYFSPREGLVFANRLVLQNVTGNPPFYALTYIQSPFGEQEGLGGSKSVRGLLRNRYFGEGLFLWNLELRWRFREIRLLGKGGHLAAIGFLDSGRVWEHGAELSSLFSDLHHGGGVGMRLGMGPNFVIAVDFARGSEAGLQTYIGLGYLF